MSNKSFISDLGDKAILVEIGNFVQHHRIKMNMTQDELADKAAMSRSTLSLIERGKNSSMFNMIKVLRMLDALYVLNSFQVPKELSPLQLAKGIKKQRQRASRPSDKLKTEDLGW